MDDDKPYRDLNDQEKQEVYHEFMTCDVRFFALGYLSDKHMDHAWENNLYIASYHEPTASPLMLGLVDSHKRNKKIFGQKEHDKLFRILCNMSIEKMVRYTYHTPYNRWLADKYGIARESIVAPSGLATYVDPVAINAYLDEQKKLALIGKDRESLKASPEILYEWLLVDYTLEDGVDRYHFIVVDKETLIEPEVKAGFTRFEKVDNVWAKQDRLRAEAGLPPVDDWMRPEELGVIEP